MLHESQIVNNRPINPGEYDELSTVALEITHPYPGVIGYINISASHSTLDHTLNATADHSDRCVASFTLSVSADTKEDIAESVFKDKWIKSSRITL